MEVPKSSTDRSQQQLSRGAQLRILRDCRIPAAPKIRGATLKAVLRSIDDHAGGGIESWPSIDTIAREADVGYRQAQRAIAALVERSLLCIRRVPTAGAGRSGCRNHYRIVWGELALLCGVGTDQRAPRGALVDSDLGAPGARPTRTRGATNAPPGAQEATTKRPRSDHHQTDEARRVVVAVDAAGVSRAAKVVPPCLARGCSADQVLAVVAYHRTRPDLGPGALHDAIELLQPGDSPDRRFPSPSSTAADAAERSRRAAVERTKAAEEQAEADRDSATDMQLERDYGPELDAMAAADREALRHRLPACLTGPMARPAFIRAAELRLLASREAVA